MEGRASLTSFCSNEFCNIYKLIIMSIVSAASELLNNWNDDRLYDPRNRCSCTHCCKSSNICASCQDWSLSIEWKSINPPHLKCNNSNCNNVYHLNCLPINKRLPNSWNICSEIGSEYECNTNYLDFFTFINKIKNQKVCKKYNKLIRKKYHESYPNKRITIKSHFCGFYYNFGAWIFLICAVLSCLPCCAPGSVANMDTSQKSMDFCQSEAMCAYFA